MNNMIHDLKALFNEWWTAYDPDNQFPLHKEDAREAFYAAYEIGLDRGHAMGQELGTAIAKLDAKIEKAKRYD